MQFIRSVFSYCSTGPDQMDRQHFTRQSKVSFAGVLQNVYRHRAAYRPGITQKLDKSTQNRFISVSV